MLETIVEGLTRPDALFGIGCLLGAYLVVKSFERKYPKKEKNKK